MLGNPESKVWTLELLHFESLLPTLLKSGLHRCRIQNPITKNGIYAMMNPESKTPLHGVNIFFQSVAKYKCWCC